MKASGERLTEFIYKLALSVAATFLLLGLVEIASYLVLRYYPRQYDKGEGASVPVPWARIKPSGTERNEEEFQAEANVEYQPWVEWGEKPFQGKTVVIEADGTRRTVNSQCGPGAYTIWMFGGSTLWGDSMPDWETIPSFLAGEYVKHGRPACVRNYGTAAWVNTQEMLKLILELQRAARPPDLVIFYDGANEPCGLYYSGGRVDTHQYDTRFRAPLATMVRRPHGFRYLLATNTYLLLERVRDRLLGQPKIIKPNIPDSAVDAQFKLGYLDNLKIIEALARQYGFRCAFFWQPVMWADQKPLTPDEKLIDHAYAEEYPGLDVVTRKIYALAQREIRPNYFDISDLFAHTHGDLYFDPWHIKGTGAKAVAARMYELVQSDYPRQRAEQNARNLAGKPPL
jgi:hypothetical protein